MKSAEIVCTDSQIREKAGDFADIVAFGNLGEINRRHGHAAIDRHSRIVSGLVVSDYRAQYAPLFPGTVKLAEEYVLPGGKAEFTVHQWYKL